MEKVKNKVYSTDKNSIEYLEINSCGVEHIYKRDRGSNRPEGRKDYHLIYVEKGVLHVFIDGKWQSHLAGSVVLFRPFEPQNYYYLEKDNSISHFVHFSGVGCETILKRLGIYDLKVFMMGQIPTLKKFLPVWLRNLQCENLCTKTGAPHTFISYLVLLQESMP